MSFRLLLISLVGCWLPLGGCSTTRELADASSAASKATAEFVPLPDEPVVESAPARASQLQQPTVQPTILPVAYQTPAAESPAKLPTATPPLPVGSLPSPLAPAEPEKLNVGTAESVFELDLPTAWRLASADNLQVGLARLRIDQALARQQRADALWLPSLRAGLNYNRHEGAIQDVVGSQFDTSRGAFYAGAGAGVFGAGAPMVPGVLAQFHLTDAYFQPLAARQAVCAQSHAAAATRAEQLLQVSLEHLELQRRAQEIAIARDTLNQADRLSTMTAEYACVGQGAQADADRAAAEAARRRLEVLRAEEALAAAGTRLARRLRLDPVLKLVPAEPRVVPVELVPLDTPVREFIAVGLSRRPETAEQRHWVAEASAKLRREQAAPLIPSVMLGASYGGLGAGIDGDLARVQDRLDVDALAYWELRNFGQGEQAARREAFAVLRQQQLRQLEVLDRVAAEVAEAYARLVARAAALQPAEVGWRAARDSLQRNMQRIEAGQGLPLEALQAVQALNVAQRDYLQAVIEYNQAQYTLHYATGFPLDE